MWSLEFSTDTVWIPTRTDSRCRVLEPDDSHFLHSSAKCATALFFVTLPPGLCDVRTISKCWVVGASSMPEDRQISSVNISGVKIATVTTLIDLIVFLPCLFNEFTHQKSKQRQCTVINCRDSGAATEVLRYQHSVHVLCPTQSRAVSTCPLPFRVAPPTVVSFRQKPWAPPTPTPWVTSPWSRQKLDVVWKGPVVLTVHPRPPVNLLTGRGP